eukprot:1800272-Pyramimonas_sp.AAC.1
MSLVAAASTHPSLGTANRAAAGRAGILRSLLARCRARPTPETSACHVALLALADGSRPPGDPGDDAPGTPGTTPSSGREAEPPARVLRRQAAGRRTR